MDSTQKKTAKQTKHGKATTAGKNAVKQPDNLKPKWPVLAPLVPSCDLHLQTVLDGQIITIKNLFTAALSRQFVTFLSKLPLITTLGIPKRGEALRVNDRFQVQDPDFAEALYSSTALKQLMEDSSNDWGGEVIGLNPNIRIYGYKTGHFFEKHCKYRNHFIAILHGCCDISKEFKIGFRQSSIYAKSYR